VLVVGTVVAARYGAMHSASLSSKPSSGPALALTPPAPAQQDPAPSPARAARPHAKSGPDTHVAEKPKPAPVAKTTSAHENASSSSNMLIVANGPAPAKAPEIPPTPADVSSHAASQPPVTITGCLESTVDEREFRLTDTEGMDAPKARSWKSGFLKKSATPVSLVGFSDPTGLKKLIGRRVAATGTLTSGELHLRSYKPAGASCSN
jgi:hypothetical protein